MEQYHAPTRRIVGWNLPPYPPCDHCGQPAAVMLEDADQLGYGPACRDCVPTGTSDEVAVVLARAFTQ